MLSTFAFFSVKITQSKIKKTISSFNIHNNWQLHQDCWLRGNITFLIQSVKIAKAKCVQSEIGQTLDNDISGFIKKFSFQGSTNLNFSVKLRTYQQEGTIMFHKMSSTGYMKLFLQVNSLLDTQTSYIPHTAIKVVMMSHLLQVSHASSLTWVRKVLQIVVLANAAFYLEMEPCCLSTETLEGS